MRSLRQLLPPNAILANGAGNFTGWLHRFFTYREFRTQLAPTNGAMGYGVPAAIGAAFAHPDRPVVSVCGDGDFLMCSQELATAAESRLPIIFLIVNNGIYGTIRMHQERAYPGRVIATDLANPDFTILAKAYGLHAHRVETTADFEPAFREAQRAGGPALIELVTSPEAIAPGTTITAIRHASGGARS
jgi:acetolactate synthase-1/2/3 large subunit